MYCVLPLMVKGGGVPVDPNSENAFAEGGVWMTYG